MEQKNEESLIDYKFMSFNGKVKYTFVCSERSENEGVKIDVYDEDWRRISLKRKGHQNSKKLRKKPRKRITKLLCLSGRRPF